MILELIFNLIFSLIEFILSFLPSGWNIPNWGVQFINVVTGALAFFPTSVFTIIMLNVGFWLTIHMGWAIIEWCYKKVPGID